MGQAWSISLNLIIWFMKCLLFCIFRCLITSIMLNRLCTYSVCLYLVLLILNMLNCSTFLRSNILASLWWSKWVVPSLST